MSPRPGDKPPGRGRGKGKPASRPSGAPSKRPASPGRRPPRAPSGRGPAFESSGGRSPARGRPPAEAPPDIHASSRVIYGRNPVHEALRGRRRVHRIWATEAASTEDWSSTRVSVVSAEELEERCGSDAHQGVVALVDPYPYADAAELLAQPDAMIVALDEVTDPQNLGAIARTAEAAGAAGIVIPERRSAEVTAAVAKASAGAVEHLPIARVRNLADFLGEAKAAGAWVYGAAAGARTPYDKPDYTGTVVLVLGAEGKGLRPRVASMCDDLVALPLRGRIESLNVSATAAVLLYEMLQQRLDT
jgi:23S rRNA (guanosine2251-2'-O)-methyltransferase